MSLWRRNKTAEIPPIFGALYPNLEERQSSNFSWSTTTVETQLPNDTIANVARHS